MKGAIFLLLLPGALGITCYGSNGCCAAPYESCAGVYPCTQCTSGQVCTSLGRCSTTATTCPPGQYLSGTCRSCPANTYSAGGTATSCTSCTPPQMASTGSSYCSAPCSAGSYLSVGTCQQCSPGTWSDAASLSCSSCSAGLTSLPGAASSAACTQPCGAGSYLSTTGCPQCPANTFQPAIDATSAAACQACRTGFVSPPGSTAASACAPPPDAYIMSQFAGTVQPAVLDPPIVLSATSPAATIFSQATSAYATGTTYYISLEPPAGYAVVVSFSSFATESVHDPVTVYPNASLSGAPLLGPLSGMTLPTSTARGGAGVTISVGFVSDGSVVYSGLIFSASLQCEDAACAGAPAQPSATPSRTPSTTRSATPTPSTTRSASITPSATRTPAVCQPGSFLSSGRCEPCPQNTFSDAAGAQSCAPCPSGTLSSGGAAVCLPVCSAGQYAAGSPLACTSCPADTFTATSGAVTSCTTCRSYLSAPPGATACAAPPGAVFMSAFPNGGNGASARPATPFPAIPLSPTAPALLVLSQAAPLYDARTSYTITLAPPPGYAVVLTFRQFITEGGYDYVSVFSSANLTGSVLYGPTAGSPSTLPAPLQAPSGSSPSVLLSTDGSGEYTGIAFLASLVCTEAACQGAQPQPSTSPLPTRSSSPSPSAQPPGALGRPAQPPPGSSPGLGGEGGSGSNPAAAGVVVSLLVVGALGGGAAFLLHRMHGAQQLSKLSAAEGGGAARVTVNPAAAALGGGSSGGGFVFSQPVAPLRAAAAAV